MWALSAADTPLSPHPSAYRDKQISRKPQGLRVWEIPEPSLEQGVEAQHLRPQPSASLLYQDKLGQHCSGLWVFMN